MTLRLLYGSGSPFAWKVWLALEHKQVPHEVRVLSFDKREHKAPDVLALNPRGKVPVLEHDGFALYESSAIVEYLEDRFPDAPPLWPDDVRARATARRIAAEADGTLYPVLRRVTALTVFKPDDDGDPAELAAAKDALAPELAFWETNLPSGAIGAADFALFPHLATVHRIEARRPRHHVLAMLGPRTRAYYDRVRALPIVETTWPPHWRG